MRTLRRIAPALLCLFACAAAPAQDRTDEETEIKLYKGLDALSPRYIQVGGRAASISDSNLLSSDELKTVVELRLRANRVSVFDFAKALKTAGDKNTPEETFKKIVATKFATLDVAFTVIKTEDATYCYSLNVSVQEPATLKRDPERFIFGVIRNRVLIGYAGRAVVKQAMREAVEAEIDALCLLYLKAHE